MSEPAWHCGPHMDTITERLPTESLGLRTRARTLLPAFPCYAACTCAFKVGAGLVIQVTTALRRISWGAATCARSSAVHSQRGCAVEDS